MFDYYFLPFIAVLGSLILAFLVVYTDYKQKMLMIKKDLLDNIFPPLLPGLRSGLIFSFLGVVLLFIFINNKLIWTMFPWYTPGSILIALGLAQLTFYYLMRKSTKENKQVSDAPSSVCKLKG